MRCRVLLFLWVSSVLWGNPLDEKKLLTLFHGRMGAAVFIDCETNETIRYNASFATERKVPCSTFKIFNTLIGAEEGILTKPEAPFYAWDGVERFLPQWNQNLSLRDAFAFSCVPAYQQLARQIGTQRMQFWLDTLSYGDKNSSSGIDDFWLPREGKQSILISVDEQATLMSRLARGELPFSKQSYRLLQEVMLVKTTNKGLLYGKTGSSGIQKATQTQLSWYVGYVIHKNHPVAFAVLLDEATTTSAQVRELVIEYCISVGIL